jgi:hypothetical protein
MLLRDMRKIRQGGIHGKFGSTNDKIGNANYYDF